MRGPRTDRPLRMDDIGFVIVGAAKSATTWLRTQLADDPAVHIPGPEPHYFSRELHRGTAWYLAQFDPPPGARLVGEKSNSYLDAEEAAGRLHAALPGARLVAMLRDPVERAYSDYCMGFRRGEVSAAIEDHLDPRVAAEGRFLKGSRYDLHLRRLLSFYDAESLHVTQYELVPCAPQAVLDGVRAHLGLPPRPLAALAATRVNDRNAALLPLPLRRRLAPLKPLVRPLRGSRPFEVVRGLLASRVAYPPLGDDLRRRMEDHFAPMPEALAALGYALGPAAGPDSPGAMERRQSA